VSHKPVIDGANCEFSRVINSLKPMVDMRVKVEGWPVGHVETDALENFDRT